MATSKEKSPNDHSGFQPLLFQRPASKPFLSAAGVVTAILVGWWSCCCCACVCLSAPPSPPLSWDETADGPKDGPHTEAGHPHRHTGFSSVGSLPCKTAFFCFCEHTHTPLIGASTLFSGRLIHTPSLAPFSVTPLTQSRKFRPARLIPIWSGSPDTGAITRSWPSPSSLRRTWQSVAEPARSRGGQTGNRRRDGGF